MKYFEQIVYILSRLVTNPQSVKDEESQRDKIISPSIKQEFATFFLRAGVALFLIIIFFISLASINSQAGLQLLTYEHGLLLFFLFHGLVLTGSALGMMRTFKLKFNGEDSKIINVNAEAIKKLDGQRIVATFFVGFIEGWQKGSDKSSF